jgi:hypothetical protein
MLFYASIYLAIGLIFAGNELKVFHSILIGAERSAGKCWVVGGAEGA